MDNNCSSFFSKHEDENIELGNIADHCIIPFLSLLLYECLDFHRKSRINSRLMILLNVILSIFHAVMGVIEMKSNVSCYPVL